MNPNDFTKVLLGIVHLGSAYVACARRLALTRPVSPKKKGVSYLSGSGKKKTMERNSWLTH